jgi:hypothetical protein
MRAKPNDHDTYAPALPRSAARLVAIAAMTSALSACAQLSTQSTAALFPEQPYPPLPVSEVALLPERPQEAYDRIALVSGYSYYSGDLAQAGELALQALKEQAAAIGANAVVGIQQFTLTDDALVTTDWTGDETAAPAAAAPLKERLLARWFEPRAVLFTGEAVRLR